MWLVLEIAGGIVLGSVISFMVLSGLGACMLSSKISRREDKWKKEYEKLRDGINASRNYGG